MMDEECLNAPTWTKIEEAVRQILTTSDLETATEFSVRAAAAQRLGFDLSAFPIRQLVRQLINSFLLSTAISSLDTTPLLGSDSNGDENAVNHETQLPQRRKLTGGGDELHKDCSGKVICQLSDRRRVSIYDSNGKTMISIRDFFIKDGLTHHSKGVNSGVSLTALEWSTFRNCFPSIEEAIAKLESRVRTEAVTKQNKLVTHPPAVSAAHNNQLEAAGSDLTNDVPSLSKRKHTEASTSGLLIASNSQEQYFSTSKQDADTSAFVATSDSQDEFSAKKQRIHAEAAPAFPTPEQMHYKVNAPHSEPLIPIQTARLDGRNYDSWVNHMELFLKQLNLAYVLVEPCPMIFLRPEDSSDENVSTQADIQRWLDDDYMCHQHILKSLCDGLFHFHSQKSCSARDLWEELKLEYDENFGTKRSQISKYVNFQMVDGVSILDQVQEIHKIVDSIMASGSYIDENFHVSVIVSKLPPSWKEFRVRLMREDHLPLNVLMLRIQVEEESRRCYRREANHGKLTKSDYIVGTRRKENKRVCYSCGREGHIIKNCPNGSLKLEVKRGNGKETNGVVLPRAETNMVEKSNKQQRIGILPSDATTNETRTATEASLSPFKFTRANLN